MPAPPYTRGSRARRRRRGWERSASALLALGVLGVAGVTLFVACGEPVQDGDRVVARVAGQPITVAELQEELSRDNEPGTSRLASPEARREKLERLVDRELLVAGAREAGYARDPAVVAVLEQALIEYYQRDQLSLRAAELIATDAEIEARYRETLLRYRTPERARVAVIWMPVPANATAETRARLRSRAEQAWREAQGLGREGGTFGALAVRYSGDTETRYKGGDIGWIERDSSDPRWGTELARAAFSLVEPGDTTEVLATEAGFAIARLVERRPAYTEPLEAVADEIRREIGAEKRERALREIVAELRQTLDVQLDTDVLDSTPLLMPIESAADLDGNAAGG